MIPPVASTETVAFFDALSERLEAATERLGLRRHVIELAGRRVALDFAGDALVPLVMPALAHRMVVDDDRPVDVEIGLWDSGSAGQEGVRAPRPVSSFTQRGDVRGFGCERIRVAFY